MKKMIALLLLAALCLGGCEEPKKVSSPSVLLKSDMEDAYLYGRSLLKQPQQSAYDQIVHAYYRLQDTIRLGSMTIEELEEILQAILRDHPEIYYLGHSFRYEKRANDGTLIYYPSYRFSKEEIAAYNKRIQEKSEELLSVAADAQNDQERVLLIYDALLDMLSYDENAKENQNILSTFVYGRTVCAGYAKSMQYLLNKLHIPCTILTGYALQTKEAHAWNMLFLDGAYYYMDPTNGKLDYKNKELRYMYAIMTKEQIDKINKAFHEEELKESASSDALYFQRKDAYFTSFDREKLLRLLQKEAKGEEFHLIYQCASLAIGEQIKKELTDGKLLHEYSRHDSFTIYEFKETCTYAILPEDMPL